MKLIFSLLIFLSSLNAYEKQETNAYIFQNEFSDGHFMIYNGHLYAVPEIYHMLECECNRGY